MSNRSPEILAFLRSHLEDLNAAEYLARSVNKEGVAQDVGDAALGALARLLSHAHDAVQAVIEEESK